MSQPASTSERAAELDDVILSISAVRYSDGTPAVRLDLQQHAFDDKSYVDLSPQDAFWLTRALTDALEQMGVDRPSAGRDAPGPTAM